MSDYAQVHMAFDQDRHSMPYERTAYTSGYGPRRSIASIDFNRSPWRRFLNHPYEANFV